MTNIRPIKDFPGYYISDNGDVLSCRKFGPGVNLNSHARTLTPVKEDYLKVSLCRGGKKYNRRIHVLVANAFLEKHEGKLIVCHKDGNKHNNNVTNLYWGTYQQNEADKVAHGTRPMGELAVNHKYSKDTIVSILHKLKLNISMAKISRELMVPYTLVSDIKYGKSWKSVTLLN